MISINFVGDVAMFNKFEVLAVDPFSLVRLPDSDFNIANFEFPVVEKGGCPKFYDVPPEYCCSSGYVSKLNLSLFDLYSIANNHIMDYSETGVTQTKQVITDAGSSWFGFSGKSGFDVFRQHLGGIDFIFLACVKSGRWSRSQNSDGPDPYDVDLLEAEVKRLASEVDHVVVFPHRGSELVDAPDDVNAARKLIDAGASCVIGHHPHVSQGIERYKRGVIAYSLGSFIYLSECEKGNYDNASIRDISICLNIEFTKSDIRSYIPYKFVRSRDIFVPQNMGDFRVDEYFDHLNSVVGDRKYYAKKLSQVLLKRELLSFLIRFKSNPVKALCHYLFYLKFEHFKNLRGLKIMFSGM